MPYTRKIRLRVKIEGLMFKVQGLRFKVGGKMKINRFEDLEVWQESRSLCKKIFSVTNQKPFKTDFKFRSQILSSSGSTMDNIAEGFERGGNKEFLQFLSIAKGSCGEVRSQLYRALDFEYIDKMVFEELLNDSEIISRKISNLMLHLRKSDMKGPKYRQP